ncbi:hypothetical protein [Chryseobacterium sp. A321]
MKTTLSLLLLILLYSANGLQAQIYFFDGTSYAGAPDSSGGHNFVKGKMKVLLTIDKEEILLINGENDEVISKGLLEKDVEITRKSEYNNYLFTYDLLSFLQVIDYVDPNKEDDLKFFEIGEEVLHLKGQFHVVYLTVKQ